MNDRLTHEGSTERELHAAAPRGPLRFLPVRSFTIFSTGTMHGALVGAANRSGA